MQLRRHESPDLEIADADMEQDSTLEEPVRPDRLRRHRLPLTCVCIDSLNEHAFTGSKDGSIIKWCLKTNKILNKINPIRRKLADSKEELGNKFHTNHINCLAISSDDKFLASGGGDTKILIWSPTDMSWLHTFNMHRKEVTALAFRQGYHDLYSGSADRSVMIWSLEDEDNRCFVEALYGHESEVTSMDAQRKERFLTTGGRDQSIRIWKIVEQAQTVFQSGEDGSITVWTTMKRSPLCSVIKAHGNSEDNETKTGNSPFSRKLNFWVCSLAAFPIKQSMNKKHSDNPRKRRRLDDAVQVGVTSVNVDDDAEVQEADQSSADEDDEKDELSAEAEESSNCVALVASGSCDSRLIIWKLIKIGGKHELQIHQSIECPGFINDLKFTSDGSRILAACGQEHRFGRWWKLRGTKNCLKTFEVDKFQ